MPVVGLSQGTICNESWQEALRRQVGLCVKVLMPVLGTNIGYRKYRFSYGSLNAQTELAASRCSVFELVQSDDAADWDCCWNRRAGHCACAGV